MLIRFWGVHGSISAPGAQTARFGGNTPCLQLLAGEGNDPDQQESSVGGDRKQPSSDLLIIDAGYGIVGLGEELMAAGRGHQATIHLILTHLHWDHIQGLPFFSPIYLSGNQLNIYSSSPPLVHTAMERLFTSIYSPIKGMENLGAHIDYHAMNAEIELAGLKIAPVPLKHTVPTMGLRISEGSRVLVHASDHEGGAPAADAPLIAAAHQAEVLIHDAQFTSAEYAHYQGWGHSATEAAVNNARAAQVKHLILFHYDPSHTDADIEQQLEQARRLCAGSQVQVSAATERLTQKI